MSAHTQTHSPTPHAPKLHERRRYDHVREIFADAARLIAPFFADKNRWNQGTLDHLAYRRLRDRYPELSFEEVRVLVAAVRRVQRPER